MIDTETDLKIKIKDLIELTSIHALPNIVRNRRKILKIFWIILLVIFLAINSYTCIEAILKYFEYEVVNNVEFKRSNGELLYPVISICSLNPFITQTALNLVQNILNRLNVTDLVISDILDRSAGRFLNQHYTFTRFLLQSELYVQNDTIRENSVHQLKEMLISCKYDVKTCSVDDFEWFYSFDFGNCYKFRPDLIATRQGKFSGLKLELFLNQSDNINSLSYSNGIHLFINNQSTEPLRAEGIHISTGYETNVALKKITNQKLSKPYSDCVKTNDFTIRSNKFWTNSNLYRLTLLNYEKYRRKSCFDMCYQNFIEENCKCYAIMFPSTNNTLFKPCGLTVEDNKCNLNYHIIFYRNVSQTVCPNLCPVECESSEFEAKVSFSNYPTEPYAIELARRHQNLSIYLDGDAKKPRLKNFDYLKKSFLFLNVYFDNLDEMVISEVAKTEIPDLIGVIGGNIGLFLGMSILSLVELVEIFLVVLFHFLFSNKNRDMKGNAEKLKPKEFSAKPPYFC